MAKKSSRGLLKEEKSPGLVPQEDAEQQTIREELRSSHAWARLSEEFSAEELPYFEESYISLMKQFRGDVLATEEKQIFHAIKYEILMSRNLAARKSALEDIARLDVLQREFFARFQGPADMGEDDRVQAITMEQQIQTAKSLEQSKTSEYTRLQERHESLMKGLKATRDQRVKQIEASQTNFMGVIKFLQDRDRQNTEGRQMELTKMATAKEYMRLGHPITYDDGSMDSPILSAETVNLGPEEDDG